MNKFVFHDGETLFEAVSLPDAARRLDTQEWVVPSGGLASLDDEEREACGWFVVDATPPLVERHQRVAEGRAVVIDGRPAYEWTVVNRTPEELAYETQQETQQENGSEVRYRIEQAIVANKQLLTQIAAEQATCDQVVATAAGSVAAVKTQVNTMARTTKKSLELLERHTRQLTGLAKLTLSHLDDLDAT